MSFETMEVGNEVARRSRSESPRLKVIRDEIPELSDKEARILDDNIEKAIRDCVSDYLQERTENTGVPDS